MQSPARPFWGHMIHVVVLLWPTLVLAGPAGFGIPVAVFAVCVLLAAWIESVALTSPARVERTCDVPAIRVAQTVGICLLLVLWIAQFEHHLHFEEPTAWLPLAGVLSVALGTLLRVAAIRALGAWFVSDIRIESHRIHVGIYRYVRHPSEVGLILISVGGPLVLGAPLTACLAGGLFLPLTLWRIAREERAWRAVHRPL